MLFMNSYNTTYNTKRLFALFNGLLHVKSVVLALVFNQLAFGANEDLKDARFKS